MPGTGKSTVVRDYFRAMAGQLHAPTSATEDAAVDALPLPYAYVDCAHVQHAPRLLFESVLRQLRGVPLECAAWNADMSELARTSSRNLLPPKTTPPSLHVSGEMQLNDFVRLVRAVCDEEDVVVGLGDIGAGAGGTGSGKDHHSTWLLAAPEHTRYIVLDRAEVLRDMAPTLLPALARLGELVGCSLLSHSFFYAFIHAFGVIL